MEEGKQPSEPQLEKKAVVGPTLTDWLETKP